MLYRLLVRPFLYRLSAESAHHLILFLLALAMRIPGGLTLLRWLYPVPRRRAPIRALGLEFPSAIGLAAGFDKDARVFPALAALGFGFVEVGTVTGEAQPGNPRPRLFRLPRDRALVNRMGFNNAGAEAVARELSKRPKGDLVLGINIGKTKVVSAEDAPADYAKSARLLAPFADYLVVNVSSPNTPGLRDLQAVEALRPILQVVQRTVREAVPERRVPVLVKIAPDLRDEDIVEVADLALELALDGIIATNTTVSRDGLATDSAKVAALGAGGLSGAPLRQRSRAVLAALKERVGDRLVLVSAGGIDGPEEANFRLDAGADLVQVYSALVFEGPSLPSRIARSLAGR